MWKAAFLEAMWLLSLVFVPSEVVKPVPPLDMVMVCWWFLMVGDFHSDSVVSLGVMVKFVCRAELCFFVKCGKSDWLNFLLHHHRVKKEVYLGVFYYCNYISNCLLEIIFFGCLGESKCLWGILKVICDSYYASYGYITLHTSTLVKWWTNVPTRCAMMAALPCCALLACWNSRGRLCRPVWWADPGEFGRRIEWVIWARIAHRWALGRCGHVLLFW